jgi:hypothetical protein
MTDYNVCDDFYVFLAHGARDIKNEDYDDDYLRHVAEHSLLPQTDANNFNDIYKIIN